ncbi:MAG TPA: hypothetical protein VLK33_10065 [Terriglobales bacterium]|nr:hypothetical protein [Terriglobales bacterium]
MPLSATEAVSPAIEHAKTQLFQPFRFGQWIRLAVVGFLAAELSSGGGCNAPSGFPNSQRRGNSGSAPEVEAAIHKLAAFWHAHAGLIVGVIAGAIIFLFLLGVLFTYINSRMRFVLFDSIIAKECHIREYWSRRAAPAWRFFIWQLLFSLFGLMVTVILIGVPLAIVWSAGWLRKSGDHVLPLVLGGLFVFVVFLVFGICAAIVRVIAKDFVVPYMAVEGLTVMEGWRRVWNGIKSEKGGYAGYIGMKIVLTIAAGIIFGIIGIIALIIIAIPLFIIGVMVGIGAAGAGLTWNAFTITLLIIVVVVGVIALMFFFALIGVPTTVFFPAYSIHFLASRYPKLDALLHPAPPAPPQPPPPVPPQMPPPFFPPEPNALSS